MNDQDQQQKEAARTQAETQAASVGHRVGLESQARKINDRKQNPQFYDKYTSSSIEDSEKWGHLANEFGVWLADDHVLSNRRKVHRLQRELLNKTRAQQSVVGATPGVRLREKPLLNALSQGVQLQLSGVPSLDATGQSSVEIRDPDFAPPMSSEERTVMDDIANVATARQAMGVGKAGSEALTTATTESRTVREDESKQSGIIASASGVFD